MSVYDLIGQVATAGLAAVQELFCVTLGYDRASEVLPTGAWPRQAKRALASPPLLFAQLKSPSGSFDIIHCTLVQEETVPGPPLSVAAERQVVWQLLPKHPYALFLFSDEAQQHWHLVNVPYDPVMRNRRRLRRIPVGPDERLLIASQRVDQLAAADLQLLPSDSLPLAMQKQHDRAFSLETLVEQFMQDYRIIHGALRADLEAQTSDGTWAHDYSLQFLNRLMVLHHLQKERSPEGVRWLSRGPGFLEAFWHAYQQAGCQGDTFATQWLHTLFFTAFSQRFDAARGAQLRMPSDIVAALETAPFLGEAVFEWNGLDRAHQPQITDARFQQILQFLSGYDFAVSENTPLDQALAVDPAMLGRIYEGLADARQGADSQAGAGIFYTPSVEIDLMCRLALKDWLVGHLGPEHRPLLTQLLLACDPSASADTDRLLAAKGLWPRLSELLRTVAIADPACGSGAFLVGMLAVLDDLVARAHGQLGVQETPFERKRRIIGESLFGVDVMRQAAELARLRLWLHLAAHAPCPPTKSDPVLPALSFNVRCGDSLVQELAGMNLAVLQRGAGCWSAFSDKIEGWKKEKKDFYDNRVRRPPVSKQQMLQAEHRLLSEWLHGCLQAMDGLPVQPDSAGKAPPAQAAEGQEDAERIRARLRQALLALEGVDEAPFVWHMAFVEVFARERKGFDIIVGNPPYVRHESIQDPAASPQAVTAADRQRYRRQLARAVYANWPRTFGYDWVRDRARWVLDARSDLYIYCFFHGLSLLHELGTFCFLTSNSWLDVQYGRRLQEFLLTRGHVKLVIDNRSRRSFARAGVNTAIVLLGPAHDSTDTHLPSLHHGVRFVMLAIPFDQAMEPGIWTQIEEANSRCTTVEYRVLPVSQEELFCNAIDPEQKRYLGDKWGGKYLRAPDIYWRILDKYGENLVRLGDVARVQRGITTGANDFFFLDEADAAKWGIEEEFLVRAVKSPRDCDRIWLAPGSGTWSYLFLCHHERRELRGTAALEYIRYGEAQGFHLRPTCRSRPRWWDLGQRKGAQLHGNYLVDRAMGFYGSDHAFLTSDNFQEVHTEIDPGAMVAACNSSLCQLSVNILGRANFGGGLLKVQTYEVESLLIPNPQVLANDAGRIVRAAGKLDLDDPDRHALDNLISDLLGLSPGERSAVHEAVRELVQWRLSKAEQRPTAY